MEGLLLVNKPAGMTSHDVVFQLRKILQTKKIGHTGTLDPNATGVLVVLVGRATKILPYLENSDKVYTAEMKCGVMTDTEDIWGKIIEEKAITPIQDFNALCQSFVGKQKQLPPMISSIKVNGKKLYEYARNNETVERKEREIEIYSIDVQGEMRFTVHCSSGTYVRSLCRDIAAKSDNLGIMTSLIREKVGQFDLTMCQTLEDIQEHGPRFISMNDALSHLKRVDVEDDFDVKCGKHLRFDVLEDRIVCFYHNQAMAIYERQHGNVFACKRGLWS